MIKIQPYIGESYSKGGLLNKKILVLGESNYDPNYEVEGYDYSQIVKDNIQKCVFESSVAFFTKISKLLLLSEGNNDPSRERIEEKWKYIAFHNYVQNIFTGARQRPTERMWSESNTYFLEILQNLKPEIILVLGIELGAKIKDIPNEFKQINIAHPSSGGFSYETWIPKISET